MARTIPVGYAEARFIQRATGDPDPWITTLGVDVRDAGGDYQGIAQRLISAWSQQIRTNQSNLVTMERVDLAVGDDSGEPLIVSRTASAVGAGSGQYLPQNNALLVQKNTPLPGRRNKGRMFLPLVLNEGQVNNLGIIDSTVVEAFNASFDTFMTLLLDDAPGDAGIPAPPVLLHSNTPPIAAQPPTAITSFTVQNLIATQRRRLR